MTLLVRDEEDIIQQNLDFHLAQGVDFFIITNNRSVDSTPELLSRYERRGVARILYEESDDYRQAEWVTRMARMAVDDYGADWVINNDADEFWHGSQGSLVSVLREMPMEFGALAINRDQFSPPSSLLKDLPWWQSMIYRETNPRNALGKPLPPKVCHRAHPAIEVGPGSHTIAVANGGRSITPLKTDAIKIAHFPIRSFARLEEFLRRLEHLFESRKPGPGVTPGQTQHRLFQLMKEGRLESYYQQLIPELTPDGRSCLSPMHVKDTRVRDMIDEASGDTPT